MRKIITLLSFIFLSSYSFAQCVPDITITTPGFYPDSAAGLPHAVVGIPYSTDIQVLSPSTIQGFSVDSVVLDSIAGLPSGFLYSCTPANCQFQPLVNGCLLITGPAFSASAVGSSYPLNIHVRAYLHIGPFPIDTPQVVSFYSIVVDQNSGIGLLTKSDFDVSQNYPNPFYDRTNVSFSSIGNEQISLMIYDMLGTLIYTEKFVSQAGVNNTSLEAVDFAPGIYMYALSNGKVTITRRMTVVKSQ